ncbi:putative CALMODULIN-BINDING PROTEIN60 [Helianthus annuus]|uniref:CALMODULIN-BINDING PROTEIN60 n=1 Tax=Helianthus annuus TaxID=4232 RepID=A0A251U8X4_HELAN|nr:calmodulin-binding protein 60 D isoform X1 [Helianthus annuus]KAF5796755.1 putative CALMODULIN-BINDING PROTEIN60 [Helianthus annuus]KAJ0548420.1 putative CALMODULIN-BINDING PROTEIN60 [Helianthus annuus]KAJ0902949.1 putative CALMODULIN-BINDING PROTEIN60 [Helianthus annuus]
MENYVQNLEFDHASAIVEPMNLELTFPTKVASPVYTGRTITGEVDCNGINKPINIMLVDSKTRQRVTNGWAASLKVKIVLINAYFCGVNGVEGVWTPLEFKNNIVVNFEKKKNILLGDRSLVLKDGIGTLGEMRFKHDRNPLRNVTFRLGAMVDGDHFPYAIKEAITYPFDVKDRRNESKNLGPLLQSDKVWQLVNISKKGPIRKRLERKDVWIVRDFLDMYNSNSEVLKEICGLKGKKWEMTVSHAKTSLANNVPNVYRQVDSTSLYRSSFIGCPQRDGSTSQQLDHITSFNYDDNINFDNNCYKPQLCEEDPSCNMFKVGCNFSIQDVEVGGVIFLGVEPYEDQQKGINGASNMEPNEGGLAKKRWMKLRATLWFSLVTIA